MRLLRSGVCERWRQQVQPRGMSGKQDSDDADDTKEKPRKGSSIRKSCSYDYRDPKTREAKGPKSAVIRFKVRVCRGYTVWGGLLWARAVSIGGGES